MLTLFLNLFFYISSDKYLGHSSIFNFIIFLCHKNCNIILSFDFNAFLRIASTLLEVYSYTLLLVYTCILLLVYTCTLILVYTCILLLVYTNI